MINLFAHRGYHSQNIVQNSIASLKAAYEKGFRAIEFDIWFMEAQLILKHDLPSVEELKILPQFNDYFLFKNEMFYWCDFKNLNLENAEEVLKLVKKCFILNEVKLEHVYFAPFITDYVLAEKILEKIKEVFGEKVQFVVVCDQERNLENLMQFIQRNKIKFVSIFHGLINKKLVSDFPENEFFAWTVNDIERIKELKSLGIKNFATDIITPQDYEKHTTLSRP